MSSLATQVLDILGSVSSTEMIFGSVFLVTILVGCLATYMFGFSSKDDAILNSGAKKPSKDETAASKPVASAKKTSKKPQPASPSVKKDAPKKSSDEEAKSGKKKAETAKPKKNSISEKTKTAASKSLPLDQAETTAEATAAASTSAEDGWITVDKKQKKSASVLASTGSSSTPAIQVNSSAPVTAKTDKKRDSVNRPQTPTSSSQVEVRRESDATIAAPAEPDEDEWIPANSKLSKKVSNLV